MGRKALYFKEIEHLLSVGYEAKDIIKITNIPRGTVYRIVDKLREEAKINFVLHNLINPIHDWAGIKYLCLHLT